MKKILTIIALSLIGVLAITTIALACVKYNYNVISLTDVSAVTIYQGTNSESFEKDTKEKQMNEILDLYKKANKQNLLNAIFQGNIGKDNVVSRDNTNQLTSKIGQSGTVAVELCFNTARNLVIDGKEYEYETGNTKTKISYQYATIVVTNNSNVEEYSIYLYSKTNSSLNSYYYKVSGLGHFADLYEYITTFDNWTVA